MDCDARSGATKSPEIRSGAEGILTCGNAADWWHRTLLILFGLIGIRCTKNHLKLTFALKIFNFSYCPFWCYNKT